MLDRLADLVSNHPITYLVVFGAAAGDVLVPLIPSETIVIAASVLAADGRLEIWLVLLATALGAVAGDNACYLLGRRVGDPVARRLFRGAEGRRRLRWAERGIRRHGAAVIVAGRLIPGGRTASTFAAGTLRMPWRRFLAADVAAATLWATYATMLGYVGGSAFAGGPWWPLGVSLALATILALAAEAWRRSRQRLEEGFSDDDPGRDPRARAPTAGAAGPTCKADAMSVSTSATAGVEESTPAGTIGRRLLAACARHADRVALREPRDGGWVDTTFAELGAAASEVARGLIAAGIRPGDRVAILGSTCPTWTLVDCGALLAGATVVPIYHTNSPEECRYVLEHSGSRGVVCEDADQLAKVLAVRDRLPGLEHVVTFGTVSGATSLRDLRDRGATVPHGAIDEAQCLVSPGDVATIVYTSGTTGPPKGCMTTHANLRAAVEAYAQRLEFGSGDPIRIFFFLPLAHTLARVTQFVALDVGGTLAFWSGDAARVLDELAQARPTHVPTVPRVLEKIHTKALAAVDDGAEVKRMLFGRALATGRAVRRLERDGRAPGAVMRLRHRLGDRLVLSRIRALFGPDLQFALTGAAPVAPEILEFFDACGVLVLEGYGMTETTAAATLNVEGEFRFGTVGRPLPGFEVRIADDDEVLMRGPHVFGGYHRDPDATRDAFDAAGWLRSGDLGAIDGDGYLRITGRKKDLIITSSGKNVSPSNLENALRESRWISQAVVYGDDRPYLVALVTLDPEEAPALAERLGIEPDVAAMAEHPAVRDAVQEVVDEVNRHVARIEQVKRFAILETDLTQASGHLTPTMKVKRPAVHRDFADRFAALYAAPRVV